MKASVLIVILSLGHILSVLSQENRETVFLKDGDVTYIFSEGIAISPVMNEIDGKDGQSYYRAIMTYPNEEQFKEMFKSIFSKKRAKELSNHKLCCFLLIDDVEGKVCRISFSLKKDDRFVSLKELDRIEQAFKSLKLEFNVIDNRICNRFANYSYMIRFNKLYDDCEQ